MTLKLSAASFLNGVRSSGLVEAEPLENVVREMRAAGADVSNSQVISSELVKRDFITDWQADKLLQGRHKGFFLGRYRLMRLLGTGQMSAVYLGRHILMDHLCAIKVLPADKVGDTSYLGRFYREAKAVAALNHPNVIRAFDVDKQSEAGTDIHFLVMEYVPGGLLTTMVEQAENHHVDLIKVVDVIRQAAEGLAHAHAVDMVHRDIKPDNLLVTDKGEVKILDLGLARFFKTTDEESLTLKHDERVIGTADYLAPEQAIDSHSVDSRADIYGLGCTFYYALTGHPPFTEGTLVQRLMAHQSQPAPPVTNDRPDVPEALLKILDRMLAKKAADRYQTARELADDLTAWLLIHATDDWKEKRLPMYAAMRLRDMLNEKNAESARNETSNSSPVVSTASSLKSSPVVPSIPTPNSSASVSAPKVLKAKSTTATATKSLTGSPKPNASQLAKEVTTKPAPAKKGLAGIVRRHPAVTITMGVLATALLIAAGIVLLKETDSASAREQSQTTIQTSQAN